MTKKVRHKKASQRLRPRLTEPNPDGCLYECRSAIVDHPAYGEILCVDNPTLAGWIKRYRIVDHQAVLFLPSPKKVDRSARTLAALEKRLFAALGPGSVEQEKTLRYSRVILCSSEKRPKAGWMEKALRRRSTHLFWQYRVFQVVCGTSRKLTYAKFCRAIGEARVVGTEPKSSAP